MPQGKGPGRGPARAVPAESSRGRTSRREFLALGLGAGAAAALAACSAGERAPTQDNGGASGRLADSVTLGVLTITDTLDPHGTLSYSQFLAHRQIYDTLITFDDRGEQLVPQLAAEWQRIDPLTVELTLRDDVKFSNGEDFTAETVVFNVNRLLEARDPFFAVTQQRLGPLVGAEAISSTKVRLRTRAPDAILLNRLTMLFMVPPRYTAEGGDLKSSPIGSGSFKVADYQANKSITYEAWDGSWRGKSTVQTAKIVRIAELAALVSALRTGEVDIIHNFQGDQAGRLREGFNVGNLAGRSCYLSSLLPMVPPFQDRRVRLAMNLAVNKEELVQTVLGGFGEVARGQVLQPGMLGYDDSLAPYPYDPERARSLLREAGYPSFDVALATVVTTRGMSEALAGYLKAVGVDVALNVLEFPVFLVNLNQKSSYPMIVWAPDYFHLNDFDPVAARFADAPPRQVQFDSDEFRKLYQALRAELDAEKRAALVKQAARVMYDEAACLLLSYRGIPVAYSKRLAPLPQTYDASIHFWKVQKAA